MEKQTLQQPVTARSAILTVVVLLGAGWVVSMILPNKKQEVPTPAVVAKATPAPTPSPTLRADVDDLPVISVAKLYEAHGINSLATDKLTKGKEMVVVGKVGETGKDVLGESFVILNDGKDHETQMMFEKADEEALLRIGKGQVAAVRGIVGGNNFMQTIVCRKCSLVKVE